MINMMLLRKNAPQKALTGAILRVVRALIGMKGQYTKEELMKPFVVARVSFSPDYSDPEVRRAMLEQGLASMNNVFSNTRPALSGGNRPFDVTDEFSAADYVDNEAFKSDQTPDDANDDLPDGLKDSPDFGGEELINCEGEDCGRIIEEFTDASERTWSPMELAQQTQERFGKNLCAGCFKKALRAANKGGEK